MLYFCNNFIKKEKSKMVQEDSTNKEKMVEDKSASLRIVLNDDTLKKINVIAPLNDIEGKKAEVVTKVVSIAINHYYKEVTVPELQNLTTKE